ncbi:hypothetical protein [Bremerella volcania]|nr:hypothetical protein [Bremerella volcania]
MEYFGDRPGMDTRDRCHWLDIFGPLVLAMIMIAMAETMKSL